MYYHFNHGRHDKFSFGDICLFCEVSVNDHIQGLLVHLKVISWELQQVQPPRLGEEQLIVNIPSVTGTGLHKDLKLRQ